MSSGTMADPANNDICGCKTPTGTEFCNAGNVCKKDSNDEFACRGCESGDCPSYAPRCDGTTKQCSCGDTVASMINTMIQNTCTTEDADGMFSCGKPGSGTGTSCVANSVTPRCFNDDGMIMLGDENSTCKVTIQHA